MVHRVEMDSPMMVENCKSIGVPPSEAAHDVKFEPRAYIFLVGCIGIRSSRVTLLQDVGPAVVGQRGIDEKDDKKEKCFYLALNFFHLNPRSTSRFTRSEFKEYLIVDFN